MTDNLDFLNKFLILPILGICIVIGYIIKQSLDFIPNKYIPLIMAFLGLILNIWFNDFKFDINILLQGLISGLASTGFYETFRNLINNSNNKNNKKDDNNEYKL